MSERIWDRFLTERDREVFAASGYGAEAASESGQPWLSSMSIMAFAVIEPSPFSNRLSAGEIPVAQMLG